MERERWGGRERETETERQRETETERQRSKIGIIEKEMVKKNESTGEEKKKGIQKKMGDHERDGGRW